MMTIHRHHDEMNDNLANWNKKPLLRKVYKSFHTLIAKQLASLPKGHIVELGSGIGDIKQTIPDCIRTDLFPSPWIDQVENAYRLSFPDQSVSDLILFDVFHHLRYPGTAFKEFERVLLPQGRVIIFDPYVHSMLGLITYGLLHHEPLGMKDTIDWFAPSHWTPDSMDYYAAQANAPKVFLLDNEYKKKLSHWNILMTKRLSAISYVLSGGYSKPQLYPDFLFPCMQALDKLCDVMPILFASRFMAVLEKKRPIKFLQTNDANVLLASNGVS